MIFLSKLRMGCISEEPAFVFESKKQRSCFEKVKAASGQSVILGLFFKSFYFLKMEHDKNLPVGQGLEP